ncbi:MAG: hypothetical protein JWM98_3184 [Thermoleophilia bacterium]|nr:hypothetical protein [Thermoleophilia bacterium]
MKTRRRPAPTPQPAATSTESISLEQLERILSSRGGRMPNDAVVLRETSRALRAVTNGCDFATLTCEQGEAGVRITGGREALDVARMLRSRAALRGDHCWAGILGRRLRFRIVRSTADATPPSSGASSRRLRTATKLAVKGVRLAT